MLTHRLIPLKKKLKDNIRKPKVIAAVTILLLAVIVPPIYGHIAEERRREMIANFPEPKIDVLSEAHNGASKDYRLEFSVEDADEVEVDGEKVDIENGLVQVDMELKWLSSRIRVEAANEHKRTDTTITVTRDETEEEKRAKLERQAAAAEERKAIIAKAKEFPPSPEFKVFDKGLADNVIFDNDEYGYYQYYVPRKTHRMLYVKASTSRPFTPCAWVPNEETGAVETFPMGKEFNRREYQHFLSGEAGHYNDFAYEDWVKFVYWAEIPKGLADQALFISETCPLTVGDIPSMKMLAKVN